MNAEQLLGGVLALIIVSAGVAVYEVQTDGDISARFTVAEYTEIANTMPPGTEARVLTFENERIEVITKSQACRFNRYKITLDEVTVYCGRSIVAQFDFKTRHWSKKFNDWVGHDRKVTLRKLTWEVVPPGIDIKLTYPYYNKAGFGRTGNGGILNTTFHVTTDSIKISQDYSNPSKTLEYCAGIRMKRLEDNAQFTKYDSSFKEVQDNIYWYCNDKGKDLHSDPVIKVGDTSSGATIIDKAGFHEIEDKGRVDIDKFVGQSGEALLVNITNFLFATADFTFAVQVDELDLESMQVKEPSFDNISVSNFTTMEVVLPNGSINLTLTEVNVSSILVQREWTDLSYRTFPWKGKRMAGTDFNLAANETEQLRFVLKTKKSTGSVKYSYLLNASGFNLEFDPVVNASINEISRWDVSNVYVDFLNNNTMLEVGNPTTAIQTIGSTDVTVTVFDGTGDAYKNKTPTAVLCTNGCSHFAWVNLSSDAINVATISNHVPSVGFSNFGVKFDMNTGTPSLSFVMTGQAGLTSDKLDFNKWYFVGFVQNDSTGSELYIDGSLNQSNSANLIGGSPSEIMIGIRSNEGDFSEFNGAMFCNRFFNAPLNLAQILLLFNDGEPTCDSLVDLEIPPDNPPVIVQNATNQSNFTTGQIARYNVNITDDDSLSFIFIESNATGSLTNVSFDVNGQTVANVTANFTVGLIAGDVLYFKIYVNDSANQFTISTKAFFPIVAVAKIITVNLCQFMAGPEPLILPNASLFDFSNLNLSQVGAFPLNNSLCGFTYNITTANAAAIGGSVTVSFNQSLSPDYELVYNNTKVLNTTAITIIDSLINGSTFINVTGNWLNATNLSSPRIVTDIFAVI